MKKSRKKTCLVFCLIFLGFSSIVLANDKQKLKFEPKDFSLKDSQTIKTFQVTPQNNFFLNTWLNYITNFQIPISEGKLGINTGKTSKVSGVGIIYSYELKK